jgi:S1-C subfamily serine protease
MPDQDLTGFSRVCPSCGRRVPRNVATCRCGATLPVEAQAPVPEVEAASSTSASSSLVLILVGALAVAGAGYWLFMPPAPAAVEAGADGPEGSSPEAAAAAPGAGASPEARAWDAAANAKTAPPPASTPDSPAPTVSKADLPASLEEMVDRVMPAVVLIETSSGRGSGFYVRHDTLITNVHVVGNDGYVTLRRMDGSSVNARVESRAPAFDIAVLKVATPSPSQTVIPMGSAQSLRPGQEIIVIGSALGTLQNSVSRGIMSGLRTSGGATLVQTDAATNPGNSGGPMLDKNGAVIGITTMGYRGAEGLNFGVAIDHARDIMEGRQANLGSERGLTDIQSQSRGSESDRQQQQGEQQFRAAIDQLAQTADSFDNGWRRFRQTCYTNPIPGNYHREWFAVLAPRGMPGNAAVGCTAYYAGMEADMKKFAGLMKRAIDDARRANVLPGTIRDALRSNRLDFEW